MRHLKVRYSKDVCIGALACVKADPAHFRLDDRDQKAEVIGSHSEDQRVFTLDVNVREEDADRIIQAAMACPVNAIEVVDVKTGEVLVGNKVEVNDGARELVASYDDAKEFVLDPAGYFLIRVNAKKKEIEVAFCNEKNKVVLIVRGKKPLEIYQTVLKQNVITRMDHAAYLGREVQKAYVALQAGLEYVQDEELDFSRVKKR